MDNGRSSRGVYLGIAGLVMLIVVNSVVTFRNVRQLSDDALWVSHTYEVLDSLEATHGWLRQAQVNQKTYILTGDESVVDPFATSLANGRRQLAHAHDLTLDNANQQKRIAELEQIVDDVAQGWNDSIEVRKTRGFEPARSLVAQGQTRRQMNQLQAMIQQIQDEERKLLAERSEKSSQTYHLAVASGVITAIAGLVATLMFGWLLARHLHAQRTAALALHDQRELLHATLSSVGDGVISTDVDARVVFMNDIAQRLTGWTHDEAKGRALEEVFHIINEATREPVENPALRALRLGEIVGLANHTILIARDGTEWPLDDSAAPIRDPAGNVSGAVLVFREVVARRESERALEQREREFRTLAESIPQLCWMAQPDGSLFWYNKRWYDYTGTTYEQMEGWGWQSVHDPAELPRVKKRWQESLRTGEPFDMVFPLKGADGTFRQFLTLIVPLKDDQGNVVRWFGTNTDVSESKRTEENLRESLERLDLTLDAAELGQWDFSFAEQNATRSLRHDQIFGYDTIQPVWNYDTFLSHVVAEDRAMVDSRYREAMANGSVWAFEARIQQVTGTIRWIWSKARIQRDSRGRVMRMIGVVGDITEKRLADERERKLLQDAAAANAKFRAFFEQGLLFAGILEVDGTIIEPNRALWQASGATREEVTGTRFWEGPWWSPSPALTQEVRLAIEQAAAGQTFRGELPYFGNDGSSRMADITIFPIKDETGRVIFLAPTGLDITDRKRAEAELRSAEERLRQSEERFRSFAENGPQIVWATDGEGNSVYLSRTWTEYTGLSLQDTSDPEKLRAAIHRDDYQNMLDRWSEASSAGKKYEVRFRLKRAGDDVFRWFLCRAVPLKDSEGKIVQWIGANADIEDQQRAEDELLQAHLRMQNVLGSITDGLTVLDKDWTVSYISDQGARILGISPERLLGVNLWKAFPQAETTKFKPGFQYAVESGQTVHIEDYYPAPINKWIECHCYPSDDGLSVYFHDISERKRAEEQIREADHRKDVFLATLAHELRNPLAAVRSGLELMRRSSDEHTVEQMRIMMERQVTQLARLVDDLMDVSRITQGKIDLRRRDVSLKEIVDNAVETVRPLLDQMGHTLSVSMPAESIVVNGDLTRLSQALLNLLHNSGKYSERGGHIWLTCTRRGNEAVIAVRDSGIGIAPNHLDHIFDLFSQVDQSLERSQGGLGIGLTIVKRLVELHGGVVEAQSAGEGKGSEFIIRLPIVAQLATSPPSVPRIANGDRGKLRVLIVDDNRDSADTLAMVLRMMSHEVRTAYNGEDAVAEAARFQPDVMLLDIGLPKINGYDACRLIRSQPGGDRILIIAQTGWGQPEDRKRTHEAGFDHHLVKPVDPDMVVQLMSPLMSKTEADA